LKIEIFGGGCPKCKATEKNIRKAVEKLDVHAEIIKVEDLQEIMNRGVIMTPAVFIDGETKIVGRVPSEEELEKIIKNRG